MSKILVKVALLGKEPQGVVLDADEGKNPTVADALAKAKINPTKNMMFIEGKQVQLTSQIRANEFLAVIPKVDGGSI